MQLLNNKEIREYIPHREPFLFVDSAMLLGTEHIEGVCRWPADNPLLSGHLPGFPLVPGVLMIEGAAQLLAVLLSHKSRVQPERFATDDIGSHPVGVLTVVRRAMFHQPVYPDQPIACRIHIENVLASMFTAHGEGWADDGSRVFRCDLGVAVTDRSRLRPPQREQVLNHA